MSRQAEDAAAFRRLHVAGDPLILFNIWDAGSALAVADAGASAIATSSWAVAAANGESDGERLPLSLALETVRSIVRTVDLPVSADIESGYADSADGVGNTITLLIEAGAVGCNLEDGIPGTDRVRAQSEQVARLQAARDAARNARLDFFINARTDIFLIAPPARHAEHVADALSRAQSYAEAGADGLFVPGLVDAKLITDLAGQCPLPLNVMVGEGSADLRTLADAGVARISHGPVPYLLAMSAIREAARTARVALGMI